MSSRDEPQFSIIIPTLQRSAELRPLVAQLAEHPRVLEVIVINNASAPLQWASPRVRVLQQGHNIFVNPAWNLGVREARGRLVAIVNDDIEMPNSLLHLASELLSRPWVGLVGADIHHRGGSRRVRLATHAHITLGYGVFMALRRKDYIPIPDDLKIWGGDDWLFWSARRPPVVILDSGISTTMGTTSGSAEFRAMRLEETRRVDAHIGGWIGRRKWHHGSRGLESFRRRRG